MLLKLVVFPDHCRARNEPYRSDEHPGQRAACHSIQQAYESSQCSFYRQRKAVVRLPESNLAKQRSRSVHF